MRNRFVGGSWVSLNGLFRAVLPFAVMPLIAAACSASNGNDQPSNDELGPSPSGTTEGPTTPELVPGTIITGNDGNPYQVQADGTLLRWDTTTNMAWVDPTTGMMMVVDPEQVIPAPSNPEPQPEGILEPEVGAPVLGAGCGNGAIDENEVCDDGNMVAGTDVATWDGCGNCLTIDPGFVCDEPGVDCQLTNYCGDGRVTAPETCDALNAVDGDGCSNCATELGFACPVPGMPCVNTVVCGDGLLGGSEACDDLNTAGDDGCAADCSAVEPGWTCSTAGLRCTATCGDGVPTGRESCDDSNVVANDGCSPACQIEPVFEDTTTGTMVGWTCPEAGGACVRSVCGDSMLQGEPCDDGNNNDLGDGCSPGCRLEPNCTGAGGTCVSSCGDGLILANDAEQCDDGNSRAGDGCSDTCTIEAGFACPIVDDGAGTMVRLPIVYRDFYGIGWIGAPAATPPEYNASGHPDFENETFSRNTPKAMVTSSAAVVFADIAAPTPNLVNATLGAGQTGVMALKPAYASSGVPAQITGAATFAQWYADTPGTNVTLADTLVLAAAGAAGSFVFDTDQFYPLDMRGLTGPMAMDPGPEPMRPVDWLGQGCGQREPDGQWTDLTLGVARELRPKHNYSFTSEVRYWFEYQGGEQLVFRGDDDVWVFINRQLVVDLGGNHEPYGGDVCGNIWSAVETPPVCAGLSAATTDVAGTPLGLEVGNVYEVVVFQAERHTCQSNYRLTLANFARRHSDCATVCGDGVIAGDEQCDDGAMNGMGYGFCQADCTPGPRCGDGVLNTEANAEGLPNELCDNGTNLDLYYMAEGDCAPGCVFPGYCGDGVVDPSFGERCDLGLDAAGASLNVGAYNGCDGNCQLGPRCGDSVVQMDQGEECDDGNRINGDTCSGICTTIRLPGAR